MCEEDTWFVLKFKEDDTVEAVPSNWVNMESGQCYWPPYTRKLLDQAIQRRETPVPHKWKLYNIVLFRNNVFDTYAVAQRKAKKATITSDLDSDASLPTKRRRIIRKYSSFSSIEECEDDCLPSRSKLNIEPKIQGNKTIVTPSSSNHQANSIIINNDYEVGGNWQTNNIGDDEHDINSATSSSQWNNSKSTRNSTIIDVNPQVKFVNSPMTSSSNDRELLLKIIQKQNITSGILNIINDRLARLEDKLSNMQELKDLDDVDSIFIKFDFPLSNDNALKEFEDFLKVEKEFKNVVKELSRLGGNGAYNFTARLLEKLIENKYAVAFSYMGKKLKKPFNKLLTNDVVIKAGLATFPNVPQIEFEQSIAKWLRRAKERKGSRN